MFVCSLWCLIYRNLSQCQILLDKLFDILDKFHKLLIFNGLFFSIGIFILDIGFGPGKPIKRQHPSSDLSYARHSPTAD